jgi:proteasome lid subunit RPN8/RPN11
MKISAQMLDEIIKHAWDCYPSECCGLLVGRRDPFRVEQIHYVSNANRDRSLDRYEIDPREFYEVDKTTWNTDLEIIGFYHSHPNHPPVPSSSDVEQAWSSYCYLIVGMEGGSGKVRTRAWVWHAEPPHWEEEPLETE